MPIELIDKIKQKNNGTFSLVDAKDIAVDMKDTRLDTELADLAARIHNVTSAKNISYEDNISIYTAVKELENTLNAEPTLAYSDEANDTTYFPSKTVELGDPISLTLYIATRSIGQCRVIVERTAKGSDASTFIKVKEVKVEPGRNIIDLGTASVLADYHYRVYVTDSLNKTAKFKVPDSLQDTLGATELNYLDFRVICGGLQFTTNFAVENAGTVFGTDDTTLGYAYTFNYAVTGYRYLLYKVVQENDIPPSVTELTPMLLNENPIVGGTLLSDKANLAFDTTPFPTTGKYKLYVAAAVSDSPVETDFSASNSGVTVSTIYVDTLEVLNADSIALTITTDPGLIYTNESFITIDFIPKTNLASADGYNQIKVIGRVIDKKNNTELSDYHTEIQSSHGRSSTWNIGRLAAGNYEIRLRAAAVGVVSDEVNLHIAVNQATGDGSSYTLDNLLFSFEADPQKVKDGIWTPSYTTDSSNYEIRLSNLNSNIGVQSTDINGETAAVLRLRGEAFGILYKNGALYNPWSELASTHGASIPNGFTLETYMRSKCIGTLAAKLISMRNDLGRDSVAAPGLSIGYDTVRMDTEKIWKKCPILEDVWQHVVVSVDREIRENPKNIEDLNPYLTIRLYVDGTLVMAAPIETDDNLLPTDIYPFVLNGSANVSMNHINTNLGGIVSKNEITNFGEGEIKLIRCYNRGLLASEVYQNYLNSLLMNARTRVIGRNGETLPTIYFTKNLIDENSDEGRIKQAYYAEKGLVNSNFETLHSIKVKKADDNNPFGSKTTLVNCTMHYYLDGVWMHENDVDVYLQGTSSLEYPVKNYQIKIFEIENGKRNKKKIFPPFKSDSNGNGIDGWTVKDYIYTLKCDYMEQSHRNNTPTACYYQDKVLDTVITQLHETATTAEAKQPYYSPAVQQGLEVNDGVVTSKYRDAIDGFACVVYYSSNISAIAGTGADKNTLLTGDIYNVTTEDSYAGSFMFNVDKEGAQLGFEIDVADALATHTINDSVLEDGKYIVKRSDGSDTGKRHDTLPCISYEGATNDNNSAAAFVPYEKHYYEAMLSIWEQDGPTFMLAESNGTIPKTYNSFEDFYAEVKEGLIFEKETEEAHYKAIGDKYDYMQATLEPRFTYADEYEDEEYYNDLTYAPLEKTINWVYTNCNNEKVFKAEFENYFSLEYCITYYLQMLTFTQVDNAGKNAMFDTWGGKLYPRPYDMDTQMGLDNSGQDIKLPSAELNIDLSPSSISGSNVATGIYGEANSSVETWANTTSTGHIRFGSYNTSESRLWKAFGKFYKKEIAQVYAALRAKGVYSVENICSYVDNMTCNAIGEKFYNKDAAQKYLAYKAENKTTHEIEYDTTYLKCLQGNRKNRYRQFLTQRLCFLDTFFSYISDTNETIELRANAPSATSFVGIHVYSPQYIRIAVDAAKQADIIAYADPEDTYNYLGRTYQGTLFNIPTTGTDKNIVIYGAGNIRAVNHTEDLNLTKYQISRATKMTDLNLSGASSLTELVFGNNTYIRNLDISGTTALKTAINLSNCSNLEVVNASGSAITGITLPEGANLRVLNLKNSSIISLALGRLALLTDTNLQLEDCNHLTTLSLIELPGLKSFGLNHLTNLSSFVLDGCDNLSEIDLSGLTKLDTMLSLNGKVTKLNLTNCSGEVFKNLNLTNLTELKDLNLSGLSVNGTTTTPARVYLPKNITFAALNLSAATISTLSTDGTVLDDVYDFSDINFETKSNTAVLSFANNSSVKEIKNLDFNGYLYGLFSKASKLVKLTDCKFTAANTDCSSMFTGCTQLTTLGNMNNWDLEICTKANSVFYECPRINYASFTTFLQKIPNVLELSSFLCSAYNSDLVGTEGYPTVLGNIFTANTAVTSLAQCFHGTRFTLVEPGLLDPMKDSLKTAYRLFSSCARLQYIPDTIFSNCTQLTTLYEAFINDSNLGLTAQYNNVPCILHKTYVVFNDSNNITNIKGIFQNCSKLALATEDLHDESTFTDFFKPLTKLENASMAFWGCTGITELPNGLLSYNTKLKNIDFMLGKTGVVKLPNNLFLDTNSGGSYTAVLPNSATHTALTTARGLFAGCTDLTGIVHEHFFKMTPNLTAIGNTNSRTGTNVLWESDSLSAPGMFANTKISGVHAKFLQPLTKLADCSMLFFTGTWSGRTYMPSPNTDEFYIYYGNSTATDTDSYTNNQLYSSTTEIPAILFSENTALTNSSYMFAGRASLTGVEKDALKYNTALTNASGMFMDCSSLVNIDLNTLFDSQINLTNISNMFAHCTGLAVTITDEIFKNCSKLTNCKSLFRDTSITGSIPASLFNTCRNTITDVSYMFAGCRELNGTIDTGYAIINDPARLEAAYSTQLHSYYEAKLAAEENESEKPFSTAYPTFEAFYEKVFAAEDAYKADDFNTPQAFKDMTTDIEIKQKGLLSDCSNLTSVAYMFSGCRNLVGPIPADMFYFSNGRSNTKISSIAGLFEDCWKLTMNSTTNRNTKDSFDNSSTIAYRDSATDTEVHRVTAYGGGCASKVYPWVSITYKNPAESESVTSVDLLDRITYFVPEDWLSALTNITNISRCFYNVGTMRDANEDIIGETVPDDVSFTYSYLKLPDRIFQKQSKIANASYAFAFCISTGASELTSTFMRNSLGTLTNISNIFFAAELKSIGTESSRIFESGALNGRLNTISRAFYQTNNLNLNAAWFYDDGGEASEENDRRALTARLTTSYAPRFYDKKLFSNINLNTVQGALYDTYAQPYYINNSSTVDPQYNSVYTTSQSIDIAEDVYTAPTYSTDLDKVNL